MSDGVRRDWVPVFAGIKINMRTGQTVDFGTVVGGKPEYIDLGQLSEEALHRVREIVGWTLDNAP